MDVGLFVGLYATVLAFLGAITKCGGARVIVAVRHLAWDVRLAKRVVQVSHEG